MRVEPALVEHAPRAARSLLDVLAPRGDGVGLVEAGRGRDRVPEALDVGLAEDGARPSPRSGSRRSSTGSAAGSPRRSSFSATSRGARPLGAALVEVGEELGLGVAGDRDRRAARVDQVVEQRERPGRATSRASPPARAGSARAAGACRGSERLDVARAALVGDLGDRANERQVLRLGRDAEELARAGD